MTEWQFTVCRIGEDGLTEEIEDVFTPKVYANSFWEAIQHPDIKEFCSTLQCKVYRIVGR